MVIRRVVLATRAELGRLVRDLGMNIGEEICGQWLGHVRRCEFVQYNLKPPGIQGEIDVLGINVSTSQIAWSTCAKWPSIW